MTRTRAVTLAPVAPMGCRDCAFLRTCGGLEESQQAMFGCFVDCGSCGVEEGACDYTCPRKPNFWRDWAEVGGLEPKQRRDLPGLHLTLPRYVPMLRHGSSRTDALPEEIVALNTFEVVDSTCHSHDSSPESLRERVKVSPSADVLLISVNQDRYVESFWGHRDQQRLADLARLGVAAMSTPNFSLFDDAPRLHSVRNLWRIIRSAEDIADAGIVPIVHVNALADEDWKVWVSVLRDNPAVRHVCKEFQTGLSDPDRAAKAVQGLRRLQQAVGRDLHPIIVGGRRVAHDVACYFPSFTIVDSAPFFATVSRKRILVRGTSATQIDNPTAPGEQLDDLLQDNVRAYRTLVEVCAASGHVDVPDAFDDEGGGTVVAAPVSAMASLSRASAGRLPETRAV